MEDIRDFSSQLNQFGNVPDNPLLVMFHNVGRTYRHVGLKTMKRYLNKKENQLVSWESLQKLAKRILTHTHFELGQHVYHRILGTAIGTKFAPAYTNIFMARLEHKIYSSTEFQPLLSLHYLDSIFCSWTDGIDNLQVFFSLLVLSTHQ